MCKYVLIGLIVVLVLLMVVSAVIVQEYGWTGFLILLLALVVMAFLAKKLLPRFLGFMITRPLRSMGKALEGSRIVIHSIAPTEAPPRDELEAISDERAEGEDPPEHDEEDEEDEEEVEPDQFDVGPLDWYSAEFSVVPRDAGSSEGRMVNRQSWNPMMITATAQAPNRRRSSPFGVWPADVDLRDMAAVESTQADIWDGIEYVEPSEQVFGEQRLRMRIGVARHLNSVAILYFHYTEVGTIQILRINVRPEEHS